MTEINHACRCFVHITAQPRQQLLLEAAGYEQDAELMSQLRCVLWA
jgi:hypothetical protein